MTDTKSSAGARVGHGSIRLRHKDSPPATGAPARVATAVATADGPVGHGTIRFRDTSAPVAADAPPAAAEAPPIAQAASVVEPEPEPELVGHGSVRFVDRTLQLPDDATRAAEADILQTLSAVS
jgi:hypothetical protein